MMSLHKAMHSSQIYTVGPAMSFFTSFCDLPQKEQQRLPFESSRRRSKSRPRRVTPACRYGQSPACCHASQGPHFCRGNFGNCKAGEHLSQESGSPEMLPKCATVVFIQIFYLRADQSPDER